MYEDLWTNYVRPAAEVIFEAYMDDGKITWQEAIEGVLQLYPVAYDWAAGKDIPNIGSEGSKHDLVCKAMDEVFDAIADPDIPWLPNWIEDPLEDGLKHGLHILTHILWDRAKA